MIMEKKFMDIAIEEAESGIGKNEGGPFGSVVVKNGEIVGRGHNEVIKQHDPTCHGEVMAIRDACKRLKTFDLSGCEIYTTGEPCPMCFGAILWANISKVYYGCNVVDTRKIGFRDEQFYNTHKEDVMKEFRREDCLKLFERYMSMPKKTEY